MKDCSLDDSDFSAETLQASREWNDIIKVLKEKKIYPEKQPSEMKESDFRRWVMRNFCELKEHVLTQCKETKNVEKS